MTEKIGDFTVHKNTYEIPIFVLQGVSYVSLHDLINIHSWTGKPTFSDLFPPEIRNQMSTNQLIVLSMTRHSPLAKYRYKRSNKLHLCSSLGLTVFRGKVINLPPTSFKHTIQKIINILEEFEATHPTELESGFKNSVRTQEDINNQTTRMSRLPESVQASIRESREVLKKVLPTLCFKTHIDDSDKENLTISLISLERTEYGIIDLSFFSFFHKDEAPWHKIKFQNKIKGHSFMWTGNIGSCLNFVYSKINEQRDDAQFLFHTESLKSIPVDTEKTALLPATTNPVVQAFKIKDKEERAFVLATLIQSGQTTKDLIHLIEELL